ncbi:hypothetical protein HYP71_gp016 [Arthrobacter phage KBurrousTX]|uniref:Tail terminator n=1 Tax=Arthrobacter phage KBurrousTX TaxID=2315608 RepID=A0A386KB93_9CAUD|nr:hypothetical protein HYP71_gp016 [Arthrobacter phage KBurrousTX]AYD81510.1 hypothetical protein KBurrousTX_16 [Arthrobacter phage KBurrousTX]
MLGSEGVSRALVYRLMERFPSKLLELRNRLQVDGYELPDVQPEHFYPTEVNILAITTFPCISVVSYETTGRVGNRQFESDALYDEYSYRYRMRVFVWGMGDGEVETDLLRKRLALAAREVLLSGLILHDSNGQYAELDPQTLKESYSDVGERAAAQYLGGAYLEFEVATQETLAAPQGVVSDQPPTITPGISLVGVGDTHPVPQPEP